MSLTGKDVLEIARLFDNSRFSDLNLEIGEFRLRIRRNANAAWHETEIETERPAPAAEAVAAPAAMPKAGEIDVPAPLLGTFYHAPRPGDPPFVSVGQEVQETTVIGIIEVMKLMNAVNAGVCGTVTAILADNGAAIEAGQPLIRVAP